MARVSRTGDIDRAVAHLIRERRVAAGVSQSAMAAALGVTFQQVQKYEKGANRVSAGRLVVIAELLKINVLDLFPEPGSRERTPMPQVSRHAYGLAMAFDRIEDSETRRAIATLVVAVAGKPEGEASGDDGDAEPADDAAAD